MCVSACVQRCVESKSRYSSNPEWGGSLIPHRQWLAPHASDLSVYRRAHLRSERGESQDGIWNWPWTILDLISSLFLVPRSASDWPCKVFHLKCSERIYFPEKWGLSPFSSAIDLQWVDSEPCARTGFCVERLFMQVVFYNEVKLREAHNVSFIEIVFKLRGRLVYCGFVDRNRLNVHTAVLWLSVCILLGSNRMCLVYFFFLRVLNRR